MGHKNQDNELQLCLHYEWRKSFKATGTDTSNVVQSQFIDIPSVDLKFEDIFIMGTYHVQVFKITISYNFFLYIHTYSTTK